ncbi:hypothetical protein JH146_0325 [Methanocaldococcus bathoardescens]|uniref:Piwi domain-containing protein n=1 Tax=Methanocaldococcus bathoardescens TaxID=1301915 RepID=A0A076LA08_9EURY
MEENWYYTNSFLINKHFIDVVSKNCVRIVCKINYLDEKEDIEKLLYSIVATLGGVYIGDYNPLKNEFSFYIWKRILNKKIKDLKSEELEKRMKDLGIKDIKNKTLLDYVTKKYESEINFEIINEEKVNWYELNWETKEKIVLGAIKAHPAIRKLIEYKEEELSEDIGQKILTYFTITVESDENENYFLVVMPKHRIISSETIYEMLKSNKIDIDKLKRDLLEGNVFITTSRKGAKRKKVKIKKIINPKEKEYWKYVEDINNYYKEKGIPIRVGGEDIHCYILIGEEKRDIYHTKNALLYKGIDEKTQKIILDRGKFLYELETVKQILGMYGNLIDFDGEFSNILTKDGYVMAQLSTVPKINIKLRTKNGIKTYNYLKLMYLFDWIFNKRLNDREIFLPLVIPPMLKEKEKIGIYIFYSNISDVELNFIKDIFRKLSILHKLDKNIPKIEIKLEKEIDFEDYANSRAIITQTVLNNLEEKEQPFLICISPKLPNNEFDELKSHLFSYQQTTFHQFMYPFNLKRCLNDDDFKKPFINSILSQFFHKMGMYLFSFSEELGDYDFIIGYDITKEKDENDKMKGIGGSAIIYNCHGHVITTVTFEDVHTSSEIAKYDKLFAKVYSELVPHLNLNNKRKIKILLLKDGRIFKKELEKLSLISKKYGFEIIYIDVRKSTKLRFFDIKNDIKNKKAVPEGKNAYTKFGRAYYVSSHYYKRFLKQPIKIVEKYHIDDGSYKRVKIEEKDIKQLILLTKINFSQLMPDKMKLPAPVHYAHKHVNAVRRGWKVDDKTILRNGCLPTI